MAFLNAALIGLKEVWSHKMRSLLTMLGIILGVSSLVTMSAIVKGMENGMIESLVAMGGLDKARIVDEDLPDHQKHLENEAPGKTMRDVLALKAGAPLLKLVSPELDIYPARLRKGNRYSRPSECVGVWPDVLGMNLFELEHGRFFTDLDQERATPVCVIGTGIRDDLFGEPDETGGDPYVPIGETIHINRQPFTIVGMFKHYESEQTRKARDAAAKQAQASDGKSQTGVKRKKGYRSNRYDAYWRKNNVVYLPLNTAWVRFNSAGDEDGIVNQRLDDIDIKVSDYAQIEEAIQQARNILFRTHNGIEDFEIRTQEGEVDSINTRIRNARISGGVIAAMSLIVGGVGIMNIMLASINERVREIGTCKALGATSELIFVQILVESLLLSILGAIVGLAASYGLVELVEALTVTSSSPSYSREGQSGAPVITSGAMFSAIAFSGLVGVVAGILPGLHAAKMDPIEALRYE